MTHSSALQLDTWTRELAHTFREGYQPIGIIFCEPTGHAPIRVDFHNAILAALAACPNSMLPDPDEALQIISNRLRHVVKQGAIPLAVMLVHANHDTLSICYCRSGLQQSELRSGAVATIATRAYHALTQKLHDSLTTDNNTTPPTWIPITTRVSQRTH